VLTAGHCTFGTASAEVWFTETAPSTAEVLSGNYTRGITGDTYTHPDYDDFATFPNTSDVGIVVLDKPVRPSTYGSLPTVGLADSLYKHELFTIVGYGVQDVQPVQVANVQRIKATVKLISLQSGYSAGFNLQLSSNKGQPHQGGLCFGDSGGPVLYGTTILAVNSFVINANCAGAGYSYRIDQPQILSWIERRPVPRCEEGGMRPPSSCCEMMPSRRRRHFEHSSVAASASAFPARGADLNEPLRSPGAARKSGRARLGAPPSSPLQAAVSEP
jgi:hypothetical protein